MKRELIHKQHENRSKFYIAQHFWCTFGIRRKIASHIEEKGKKIFERFMKRDPSYYNSSMLHLPMLNCAMTRNDDKKTSIPFMWRNLVTKNAEKWDFYTQERKKESPKMEELEIFAAGGLCWTTTAGVSF